MQVQSQVCTSVRNTSLCDDADPLFNSPFAEPFWHGRGVLMNQVLGDPTHIANVRMPNPDHLNGDHSTVMS